MRLDDIALRRDCPKNQQVLLGQNRSREEFKDFSAHGAQQLQIMTGIPSGQASRQTGLQGRALDRAEPVSGQSAVVVAERRILPSPSVFEKV